MKLLCCKPDGSALLSQVLVPYAPVVTGSTRVVRWRTDGVEYEADFEVVAIDDDAVALLWMRTAPELYVADE